MESRVHLPTGRDSLAAAAGLAPRGRHGTQRPQRAPAARHQRVQTRAETSSKATKSGVGISAVKKSRQVLTFTEPRSGVEVVLVGTMHYNPSSISLASSTVRGLAEKDALAALVLETCPSRWSKTMEMQAPGSALRVLLDNEFLAAYEAAEGSGAAVVLGDQRIQDLGKAVKTLASSTMADLANPVEGWPRLVSDIRGAWKKEIVSMGADGLEPTDLLLDPRLILSAPVSLARYPLAWLIKSPLSSAALFSFTAGMDYLADRASAGTMVDGLYVSTPEETALTVFFFGLEVLQLVLFSRLFLVALLGRRNDILASSILSACQEASDGSAVVAILGAAHLNGIQHRLLTGSFSSSDEPLVGGELIVAEADATA